MGVPAARRLREHLQVRRRALPVARRGALGPGGSRRALLATRRPGRGLAARARAPPAFQEGDQLLERGLVEALLVELRDVLTVDVRGAGGHVAVDELTGFIVACALVRPTKSLLDLPVKSIMKKFKDKAFCRAIDRDHLRTAAEEFSIPFRDHVENVLSALQGIASELGLAGTE